MSRNASEALFGSFRDPSGFIFIHNKSLYRQVNHSYKEDYDQLLQSGLYESLVNSGLLIPHEEQVLDLTISSEAYKIIKPKPIPFISYPYEWTFGQFKKAALTTLNVQKKAIEFGMCLKDASAFNIQFRNHKPVFVDTLSFEKIQTGKPWVAYQQFCGHFLSPLALMALRDIRFNQLLQVYLDGLPLDMTSSLLPLSSYLKFPLLIHLHLHAKSQNYFSKHQPRQQKSNFSTHNLSALIDSLETAIKSLNWRPKKSIWSEYYRQLSYSSEALTEKENIVASYLDEVRPKTAWDLGANIGRFSQISSKRNILTIAFENDAVASEINYQESVKRDDKNLIVLRLNLTNPSPSIGWGNKERMSLIERGPADVVFALALIHHLAISNNLPMRKISNFMGKIAKALAIEFVPKDDPQTQTLLLQRKDIFPNYRQEVFETEFGKDFTIKRKDNLPNSKRVLYLMEKK